MATAGGIAIIYFKNFSNPFDKLINISTIAFTIGSLLLVVWSEIRSLNRNLASETLETSKKFMKSGVYILLLAYTTPLIKGEKSSSLGNFEIPKLLVGAGDVMTLGLFAVALLLGIFNFGFGISRLINLISKIEEENLGEN